MAPPKLTFTLVLVFASTAGASATESTRARATVAKNSPAPSPQRSSDIRDRELLASATLDGNTEAQAGHNAKNLDAAKSPTKETIASLRRLIQPLDAAQRNEIIAVKKDSSLTETERKKAIREIRKKYAEMRNDARAQVRMTRESKRYLKSNPRN